MKFNLLIASAIIAYCTSVEAAPTNTALSALNPSASAVNVISEVSALVPENAVNNTLSSQSKDETSRYLAKAQKKEDGTQRKQDKKRRKQEKKQRKQDRKYKKHGSKKHGGKECDCKKDDSSPSSSDLVTRSLTPSNPTANDTLVSDEKHPITALAEDDPVFASGLLGGLFSGLPGLSDLKDKLPELLEEATGPLLGGKKGKKGTKGRKGKKHGSKKQDSEKGPSPTDLLDEILADVPVIPGLKEKLSNLLAFGSAQSGDVVRRSEEIPAEGEINASGFLGDLWSGRPDILHFVPEEMRPVLANTMKDVELPDNTPEHMREPLNYILDSLKGKPTTGKLWRRGEATDSSSFLEGIMSQLPELMGMVPGEVQEVVSKMIGDMEVPDSVPADMRTMVTMVLDALKHPSQVESSDEDASEFMQDLMSDLPELLNMVPEKTRTVLAGMMRDVEVPADVPEDIRHPVNVIMNALKGKSTPIIHARGVSKDQRPDYRPFDDSSERVRGHDRLNDAEELRQQKAMKLDNPTLEVRQKDMDRITKYMMIDALSVGETEYCNRVKDMLDYFALNKEPRESWYAMCQEQYNKEHAKHDSFKDDPIGWEEYLHEHTAKAANFNVEDWVRIHYEDMAEVAAKMLEKAAAASHEFRRRVRRARH